MSTMFRNKGHQTIHVRQGGPMNLYSPTRMLVVLAIFFLSIQSGVAQTKFSSSVAKSQPVGPETGPPNRKILVESFVISGTRSIEREELEDISNLRDWLEFR